MRHSILLQLLPVLFCLAAHAQFESDIRPLVESYCVSCHNPDKTKGDLNLARFETQAMVQDSLAVWQRVAKRIESHEMPPQSRPQPSDAERKKILEWIGALQPAQGDCGQVASEESVSWYPGYVMSRRLNRAEYQNTLRDLFGLDLEVAELFPADGAGGEGFDNNGNALFLSAIQVEKYLEAADLAVETVLPEKKYGPLTSVGRLLKRIVRLHWRQTDQEKQAADARDRLLVAKPGPKTPPRDAAREVLQEFVARAWRRPTTPDELDKLLEMYDRGRERGDNHLTSLKLALKAALISPNFVFLVEPEPETPGVYALGDYPLAARLSYFLWGTMPDADLFALAAEGRLHEDEELKRQVQRMLLDPRAEGFADQFAAQWLSIRELGETKKPDEQRFPAFDERLARDMHQEVTLFFSNLLVEDRSLLELLDADYTFANERLAALYGIDGVTGEAMQRVQLADNHRGGVLGMAAVLTATSHPLRTSPVLRGKWVLEQLLGDNVPPPPPGVGSIPEDDHQPDGLTLRERMEAHRANPDCAGCHARMDPIGFGLENFDPIGRWRAEQAGQPVDAKGVLPSGEAFDGPDQLKEILLAKKDQFATNLTRKMLGYALGRNLAQFDDCVVTQGVKALQENGYKPSSLIQTIVLSSPFRNRFSGGHKALEEPFDPFAQKSN